MDVVLIRELQPRRRSEQQFVPWQPVTHDMLVEVTVCRRQIPQLVDR
jgi:hypothetical protein